jgi:cob(I)alamin adenosyltransferase
MGRVKKMGCDIELTSTGKGFCGIQGNPYPYEEHRRNAQDAVRLAHLKMESGKFDILILDQVLDIIRRKPPLMHLVLTARDAHPQVIELAHTVSEVREIKHAFREGIEPQPGIDY